MILVFAGIVIPVEFIGVVNVVAPFRIETTDGCLIIDEFNDVKRQVCGPAVGDEDVETDDEDDDDNVDDEPDEPLTDVLLII